MDSYGKRIQQVQKVLKEQDTDFLVLAPSANMFYLTGLKTVADERFQAVVISQEGIPLLVLPEMYKEIALFGQGSKWQLITWADQENPMDLIAAQISVQKSKVAVDDRMWTSHFLSLRHVFGPAEFYPASQLMKQVRVYKDEEELDLLRRSGALIDQVMEAVMQEIRPGIKEKELAAFVESQIKTKGGDDISFKPIVAAGPNGSSPHHVSGERALENGDFVIVDIGAVLNGYCSDITRTFCLGKATPEMKKVYQAVQAANEAGFKAAAEGVPCEKVDQAARQVIAEAGYGSYFIHRTGHGIGLDYHEEPYMVEGNNTPLEVGMVFSVEPGIYLPGKFGVRIEDIVALTKEGPVRFNNFSRNLIEL
ncbi:MAG TPA: aminopeptidase P family protein [Clostridia bacterium]|nr:aminopeptidase P family protein [Clostridia bacterium]